MNFLEKNLKISVNIIAGVSNFYKESRFIKIISYLRYIIKIASYISYIFSYKIYELLKILSSRGLQKIIHDNGYSDGVVPLYSQIGGRIHQNDKIIFSKFSSKNKNEIKDYMKKCKYKSIFKNGKKIYLLDNVFHNNSKKFQLEGILTSKEICSIIN